MSWWITRRVGNAQPWPLLDRPNAAQYAAVEAMSTSGKTTLADFPPSSNTRGLRVSAAERMIARAPSGPPVKEIFSTPGWHTSAAPAGTPPGSTLMTPGGTPASRASSTKS
ncbi:hypothetical protein D9M68_781350 [compost metagenome]